MRKALMFMLGLAVVMQAGLTEAKNRLYGNARFGFFIAIPDLFPVQGPEPDNGDGLSFSTQDGSATIAASGGWITEDSFAAEIALLKGFAKGDGWTLSYESQVGAAGAAYSGRKGGRIFYERQITTCGGKAHAGYRLEYPGTDKARYDAAIKTLNATLKARQGSCG